MTHHRTSRLLIALVVYFLVPTARLGLGAQNPSQYQNAARAALQSQMAHEGKDCQDARSQYDMNVCIGQVRDTTQRDFDVFYQNLLSLLAPEAVNQEKLKGTQEQWLEYRSKSCEAIGYLYRGGSIQGSAVTACEIQLTRSRMRDLDGLYNTVLHN